MNNELLRKVQLDHQRHMVQVQLYQITSRCERTAAHVRTRLLRGDLSQAKMDDVRVCLDTLEQTRQRLPDRLPGHHEVALMRLVELTAY